jgi:hypothetical protein
MMLDSFTSNWQNALFNEYGVTSIQMMCAVNLFSCLLTATSLFQQSSIMYSLTFMATVCKPFISYHFILMSDFLNLLFNYCSIHTLYWIVF